MIFYLVNVSITKRICDFFPWIKFICKECAKALHAFLKKMFMSWRHNRFQILIFLIKIMVLSVHLPLCHLKASIRLIVQDTFLPWTIVEVYGKAIMDENRQQCPKFITYWWNVKVNHDDAWLAIKRLRGYTLDSNTHSYEVINIFPEQ